VEVGSREDRLEGPPADGVPRRREGAERRAVVGRGARDDVCSLWLEVPDVVL